MRVVSSVIICLICFASESGIAQSKPATAQSNVPNVTIYPYELITVNRFGVYPEQITRASGPFLLVIRNRSLRRAQQFNIVPLTDTAGKMLAAPGSSVASLATSATAGEDNRLLNLQPGKYQIQFVNASQLNVTLVITQ